MTIENGLAPAHGGYTGPKADICWPQSKQCLGCAYRSVRYARDCPVLRSHSRLPFSEIIIGGAYLLDLR
jgi:hypothetical protein